MCGQTILLMTCQFVYRIAPKLGDLLASKMCHIKPIRYVCVQTNRLNLFQFVTSSLDLADRPIKRFIIHQRPPAIDGSPTLFEAPELSLLSMELLAEHGICPLSRNSRVLILVAIPTNEQRSVGERHYTSLLVSPGICINSTTMTMTRCRRRRR